MTSDEISLYLDILEKDEEWLRFVNEYFDNYIIFNIKEYDKEKLKKIHERITGEMSKNSQIS